MRSFALLGLCLLLAACGPAANGGDDDDDCGAQCMLGAYHECVDGELQDPVFCVGEQVCSEDLGCVDCHPGMRWCDGMDIRECNDDGSPGAVVETCGGDQVCAGGYCVTACEQANIDRSNIGCEYWAVDLDNEYSPPINDAAAAQFAVVLANASDFTVTVTVEQNDAAPGQPLQLSTVRTAQINPNTLVQLDLPRREVDGSVLGTNEGTGTELSSRAYRITTDYPVVAYQFNPIVQDYSNGASLLIPTSGLDESYWVLGWATSNPVEIPGFPIEGIPDHSYVTIVGVSADPVTVQVQLGGAILGGGGIPQTNAGGMVQATLGPFDVLNLESTGIPGDLTGTHVIANGPVAVFSGGERASVPGEVRPPEPSGWKGDVCCTEHFEQQLFPVSSLGKAFVTTRSPIRSGNPNRPEGDVWRVMATEPGTVVTTNLDPPFQTFNLGVGEHAEFWSQTDFILTATEPVMVAQYLVAQDYVEDPIVGGDPEFILYPPAEQYRSDYIFLVPTTWERNYCVIAAPANAQITLDGETFGEFSDRCTEHPAGTLDNIEMVALRCELSPGVHYVESTLPVGVTVYGYFTVGSYGYPAGADVKRINVD